MDGNGRKWLECWNWLKMAGNGLKWFNLFSSYDQISHKIAELYNWTFEFNSKSLTLIVLAYLIYDDSLNSLSCLIHKIIE